VFGGVERGTGKCFLVEVGDRTAATLSTKIREHILPGTHIISDSWAAYAQIDQTANGIFTHEVVVHQNYFLDPNDADVHTQNVENLWMKAKRKIRRQFGTSQELFTSYLREFLFRNCLRGKDIFVELLTLNVVYAVDERGKLNELPTFVVCDLQHLPNFKSDTLDLFMAVERISALERKSMQCHLSASQHWTNVHRSFNVLQTGHKD